MERGNRGIRISDINDPVTRFTTRLLGCKLMCKCRKEEVSARVVAVVAQCAKGSSMSWAPYLLNSFLEDCKDTQDWGSEFHYSWLLILISLIGWKEPAYRKYCERMGQCGTTRYISLRNNADPEEEEGKHGYVCTLPNRNTGTNSKYMVNFTRDCPGVWTNCQLQGNVP
jgi:hypothetical protein